MKPKRYKRHRDYCFFDQDIRLCKLSQLGDPLEHLSKEVDFELFRNTLEAAFDRPAKGKGGRPPYDYVLMFKILILQRYYNLTDDQIEFQINDRLTFMRFLNITLADDVPDSKTVWNFTECLTDLELVRPLFDLFHQQFEELGLIVNEGKIIDASFVEAPRQRNSREENKKIKEGEGAELWQDKPHKKCQKDVDAAWTKKNGQNYYGYKNHTKIDAGSKLIDTYAVSKASTHDSQAVDEVLEEKDKGQDFYGDSAYVGQEAILEKYEVIDQICDCLLYTSPSPRDS